MSQLAFDLPHRASNEGADFLVAEPNAAAVAMIDRWPHWPSHALALAGPAGAGKSHLAAVWQTRACARRLVPEAVAEALRRASFEEAPAIILEDAPVALEAGRLAEADLLHLYNWVGERGGWLLLTARRSPARWPVTLADLRSRLAAMPVAGIEGPDDDLLAAVLVKQLADRQLIVAPNVVAFLLPRIERSFAAVREAVAALDRESLRRGRAITVALAREVLTRHVPR